MQVRRSTSVCLNMKSRMNFNALWGPVHERPLVEKVSTTSSWPAPYY